MDICYYNSQIRDELDGAAEYIKRAINCKAKHPEWAALYAKMSEAELDHAKNLIDIYEDDLKSIKMEAKDPDFVSYLDSESKILRNMYAESVAKIKYMQEMFNK